MRRLFMTRRQPRETRSRDTIAGESLSVTTASPSAPVESQSARELVNATFDPREIYVRHGVEGDGRELVRSAKAKHEAVPQDRE